MLQLSLPAAAEATLARSRKMRWSKNRAKNYRELRLKRKKRNCQQPPPLMCTPLLRYVIKGVCIGILMWRARGLGLLYNNAHMLPPPTHPPTDPIISLRKRKEKSLHLSSRQSKEFESSQLRRGQNVSSDQVVFFGDLSGTLSLQNAFLLQKRV